MSLQLHIEALQAGQRRLVSNLQLEVPPGHVHTLMGPSGSGKSSVLAAISGTLGEGLRLQGQVLLDGQRIDHLPTALRRVGLLFQDDLLFAHMTVRENLLFALPRAARTASGSAGREAREALVLRALEQAELPGLGPANPATLSGGQRARVALMRALLAEPRALLLDEPFARLDIALRQRMRDWVFTEVRARGIPALLVSHDPADVADPQRLTLLTAEGTNAQPVPGTEAR